MLPILRDQHDLHDNTINRLILLRIVALPDLFMPIDCKFKSSSGF